MKHKFLFTVFVSFFIIILLSLGTWQLVRLNWKIKLINQIESSLKNEPINLSNIPLKNYLKVKTKGSINYEYQIYLYNLNEKGEPGFEVVSPLTIDDKNYLLNRGWIPFDKKNNKIISLEKTNARYLKKDQFEELIDIMVCDVSFISLKKVIEPNVHLLKKNSIIIALIKPQFESKKNETKKGVIKDNIIHQRICNEISEWFNNIGRSKVLNINKSPIKGPKGNTEFLITVKYQK